MADDSEQQFMETSENGNEEEEEALNGAAGADTQLGEGEEAAQADSQNGAADGGQIEASKGEEDAG